MTPDPALRRRVASGVVLALLALVDIWAGGWYFAAAAAFVAVIMAIEWVRLLDAIATIDAKRRGVTARAALIFTPGLAIAVYMQHGVFVNALAILLLGAFAAGFLAAMVGAPPTRWAFGPIYIGAPMLSLVWLREIDQHGVVLVVWLLFCVWATDIGAYFVGRAVGGPKLAPRWSPGKTWAGLLGGMASALVVGALIAPFAGGAPLVGDVTSAAAIALLVAGFAQAGDLFESAHKRLAGVKDSGDLIPGHGGALDRLDGVMFAAPLFAATLAIKGVGA